MTQYTGATSGAGSIATQSAAYDLYGNITSLTSGAGLTLSTSTSSNRLGSASYDSAGSMTWWNNNTYAYEPLGMTRNIVASGVETVHIYRAYHLYHPYGAEATAFNQDAERLKFPANEQDLGNLASAADDIEYMHARFSQPQVANPLLRFFTR